ncbi:aldo/keto reductase [Paenibacillus terreus]|uniref:Aldo/keto reductase n=2 Tax=Paenibacillus terreus TaxID=1387834 RepID=A0ABV5B906_9BACL
MKYVTMKNSQIPAIALGIWSWGTGVNGGDRVFGNNYNAEDLRPVYQKAIKHGFTLWDTAAVYGYGASETILGQFIKEEQDILISTKFTPFDGQEQNMRKSLNESMERLGKQEIDLYWIHNPRNVEKWTQEIIPLAKENKIKHIGVSNHNLDELKLVVSILEKEGLELSAVQNHYSLLYRESEEAGIIDWCNQNQIVFFSYMVLEQGALTGKYNANHPFKSNTRRGEAFNIDTLKKLQDLIEVMGEIGDKYKVGQAPIAMAWAIAKGTVPIIGVTKEAQIDDALAAIHLELEVKDIHALEEAAMETGISIRGAWEKSML